MNIKPGARRGWRRLWIALASLAGAAGLVEVIAAVRVRQLRAERVPLDGRLYAEVRGQGNPMVFLAGLPGTMAYWDHSFDSLAQGRADEITSLPRIHALATRIGARVVETEDDHTSYSFRNPGPIVAAIEGQ
ncbi:MAG TPA: hypothetical protein VGS07_16865 [Thermoanaerobaculia bacterium]|jgi:hypothetical protein|nr:hypothetical protein [Thermoanaerobaculia bacterium]